MPDVLSSFSVMVEPQEGGTYDDCEDVHGGVGPLEVYGLCRVQVSCPVQEEHIVRVRHGRREVDLTRRGLREGVQARAAGPSLERRELRAAHDHELDGSPRSLLERARNSGLVPEVRTDLEELPREDIERRLVTVDRVVVVQRVASDQEQDESCGDQAALPERHWLGRHPMAQ